MFIYAAFEENGEAGLKNVFYVAVGIYFNTVHIICKPPWSRKLSNVLSGLLELGSSGQINSLWPTIIALCVICLCTLFPNLIPVVDNWIILPKKFCT